MESKDKACWQYMKPNENEYGFPVLGILIEGPLEKLELKEERIRIDTGYDGFLLLSEEKYKNMGFHLSELPRRYWPQGETITGEIFRLRRAMAIIQIPKLGIRFEGYVDTFRGNIEDLVGLGLIKSLRLLLDGPKQLACIIPL